MPDTARGLHYVVDDVRPPWRRDTAPVVFHHGIGATLDLWSEWIPVIAAHYPVLRFDMRGFGRSQVPAPDHVWSMADMVEDLWDTVDCAGLGAVHLVGESFGATITLAAAIARSDRVLSVRVLNGTYKGNGLGELDQWSAQFAGGDATAWSRRMMENRFVPGLLSAAAQAWFQQTQDRTVPHVAIGLGSILAATDLTAGLQGLDVPLSIVLPEQSPFVPVAHGREMAALAPQGCLRTVPGVRHGLPFSHAHQEARHLLETLNHLSGH